MGVSNFLSFWFLLTFYIGKQLVELSRFVASFYFGFFQRFPSMPPEYKMKFNDYANYFKFPAQTHQLETSDGYILTLFRLQKKNSEIKDGLPVVLLQHGLLDQAETFLINSEYKSPAFILANEGFDV